jgi:type VI secretion system protein ImpL
LLDRTLTTANRVLGNDTRPQPRPGEAITRHFESINKLLEGSPAPIEVTLQKFAAIHNVMSAAGGIAGPSSAQYAAQVAAAFRDLELHAKTLPPVLGSVVSRASGSGTSVVRTQLKGNFMGDYNKVINECRMLAQGRYPLLNNGVDMTLADFAKLFGPNGTYDTFFREQLQTLVDTSARGGWKWKPDAEAIGSRNIPLQFQRADAIRRIYFPSGSDPKVAFEVSIDSADELVQRATLSVDGQKYEFRNGPAEQRTSMVWPGRVGMAELSMTMPGFNPSEQTDGPWAMFKLFSNKTADFQPRGNKFVATFTLSAVSVRLLITPGSSLNPFGKDNPIKGFNCQG